MDYQRVLIKDLGKYLYLPKGTTPEQANKIIQNDPNIQSALKAKPGTAEHGKQNREAMNKVAAEEGMTPQDMRSLKKTGTAVAEQKETAQASAQYNKQLQASSQAASQLSQQRNPKAESQALQQARAIPPKLEPLRKKMSPGGSELADIILPHATEAAEELPDTGAQNKFDKAIVGLSNQLPQMAAIGAVTGGLGNALEEVGVASKAVAGLH